MLQRVVRIFHQVDDILEHLIFDASRRRRAGVLMIGAALLVAVGSFTPSTSEPDANTQDATLLLHRPWLDRLPESWDTAFRAYYFGDYPLESGDLLFVHQCGTPSRHLTRFGGMRPRTPHMRIRWMGKGGQGKTK